MTRHPLVTLLDRIEETLVALILSTMVVTIAAQVLARYVFNFPLAWTEELARYLFIWLVFVGGSQAMRYGEHIAIGMLADNLPAPIRRITAIVTNLLIAAFLLVLIAQGWRVVLTVAPLMSIALKVTMALVYLPLVVGGAAMLVRTLLLIVQIFRHGAPEIGARSL